MAQPDEQNTEHAGIPGWFLDGMTLLVVLFAGLIVYSNSVSGDFVLDDTHQIVANELLLQSRRATEALTSDLWAFRGSTGEVNSYYWRPTLVVYWMVTYRLFGLRTFGWHIGNILLHAAVMVVAYGVLRQLSVSRRLAAGILLIFAVHPVHVESVAWISGSSDPLVSIGMLASLWCILSAQARPSRLKWVAAVALFVPTVLAKENGVLYPLLVFAAVWAMPRPDVEPHRRTIAAALAAVPFAVVAGAYLVGRALVLGVIGVGGSQFVSMGSVVLTIPSVLAFYLRQIFFPYWIGPSYPLRPLALPGIGLTNFVLPALIVIAAGFVVWRLVRREPVRQIGLALWLLPLLPALNIGAFSPEHIAHDRYLYLSLLGALMVVVPAAAAGLRRIRGLRAMSAETACLVAAVIVSVPLAAQTFRSNRDYLTDVTLAEAFIRSDPTSTMNYTIYGLALHRAGRTKEAIAAFDRALEIHPWHDTYVFRSAALMEVGRLEEAERDLREVISTSEKDSGAYERLADCLMRQHRLDAAEEALREARREHPLRKCGFTARLAVILAQLGRPEEALAELESVRGDVESEYGLAARMVVFQIGVLYAESGRQQEAREALGEYLETTAGFTDPPTRAARAEAQRLLRRLEG